MGGYNRNYLTPGQWAQQQAAGDDSLKYNMYRQTMLDNDEKTRAAIAYQAKKDSDAKTARGIGGLFKVGGAVAGGVAGGLLGGPVGALAGIGAGEALGGGVSGVAGGDAGSSGSSTQGLATLAGQMQQTPPPAAPADPNAGLMLQDNGDAEFKKWLKSKSGDPLDDEGYSMRDLYGHD